MNTVLNLHEDPLVYEFANKTDAADYDEWFRAKVSVALNSNKPAIPHDEVVARMRAKMAERLRNAD